jgi:hypothetical protein
MPLASHSLRKASTALHRPGLSLFADPKASLGSVRAAAPPLAAATRAVIDASSRACSRLARFPCAHPTGLHARHRRWQHSCTGCTSIDVPAAAVIRTRCPACAAALVSVSTRKLVSPSTGCAADTVSPVCSTSMTRDPAAAVARRTPSVSALLKEASAMRWMIKLSSSSSLSLPQKPDAE